MLIDPLTRLLLSEAHISSKRAGFDDYIMNGSAVAEHPVPLP